MSWAEVPPASPPDRAPRPPRWRAAVPPLLLAGLLALIGVPRLAGVVVIGAGIVLALTWLKPSLAARIEGLLAAVGHAVGRALTVVLLGVVELLVFLPLAALAAVFRRDPLVERGAGRPGRWVARRADGRPPERRPFALEDGGRPGRLLRGAYLGVRVVGWVVIVLVLNYGLGWLWDEWFASHDQPVPAAISEQSAQELASSPAMADAPWARGYWDEFRALDYEFHPFVLSRVAPADGPHITVDGPVRRSYEAPAAAGRRPEVWFLGGSALWGEGQRDEHTIPSEVARRAEAAGTPIRAVNLGQPGYTSWQSALLLEQQLAVRPAPDLVVLYDGADDVAVQLETPSEDPVHYDVGGVTEALTGRDSARDQAEDWWETYRETSVVNRLLDGAQSLFGVVPAGAEGPGIVDRVEDLHARSLDLARFAAAEHDVPVVAAWQAAEGVPGDGGAYRRVAGGTGGPDGPVDLSAALDDADRPVFLDGVLTNELGARLVAARLWPLVEEGLR